MARTQAVFRQADVARAVKAVRSAHVPVSGVEIAPDGTIRILTSPTEEAPLSAFDSWKKKQQ